MDAKRFLELLNEVGLAVRTNYSGRGMYGKQCIGFVADSHQMKIEE